MDWVVLAKVVPDVDTVRYDPSRGRMIREGVDLFLNPFDQRALRVALDQRRPGERVTVLSMGPRNALPALRETRALGADRAILLTDRRLAGADTLVTSRVLARALEGIPSDLVLTGRWSTDSDTGQVAPQVAAWRGWTVLTDARRLVRLDDGRIEVDVDTESGWARARWSPPGLVSVGEKITKIRKLLPEEASAASALPVEEWDLDRLGLPGREVGVLGSPTTVEELIEEAPARYPIVFADGSIEDRVTQALRVLEGRPPLTVSTVDAPSTPPAAAPVFAVLVTDPRGVLDPSSLPILTEARRTLPDTDAAAIWVGPAPSSASETILSAAGARHLWWTEPPEVPVSPEALAGAVETVIDSVPAITGIGLVSDRTGRIVGSQVAVHRRLGMTGDATGFRPGSVGIPRFLKPAFGGRMLAVIGTRSRPAIVTVRPGALAPATAPFATTLERHPFASSIPGHRVEWVEEGRELGNEWGDLRSAATVYVVGQGVGSAEAAQRVRQAALASGGAVAATRRVVDLGWVPRQLQVGLTGLAIAPDLAVLLGVGGSMNHLTGLRRARTLLAVNRDPSAPVFSRVDLGIVGEWETALAEITRRRPRAPPTALAS